MVQKLKGGTLSRSISDYLLENGAVSLGISTRETLADSPPSADITYLMENGLSAITFATAFNKEGIRSYLAKEDRNGINRPAPYMGSADRLRDTVAEMLRAEGHQALATEYNVRYRTDVEGWSTFLPPDISHRYLAVASGAGSFGWSGNVGVRGYGTAVNLATVITDAELEPTSPIPEEESFCSDCKACVGACPMGMFSSTEEMSVRLGGREYTYSARIAIIRCAICCTGGSGLHKSRKWSSWSPGRFAVPEDNREIYKVYGRVATARENRPPMGGEVSAVFGGNSKSGSGEGRSFTFTMTCALCQLVCTGDKAENLENLRTLRNSGCIIQYPDGSLKALPPDEAETEFQRMPAEHRALYC